MNIPCKKCGSKMIYEEGPGHLWKATCEKCDYSEGGTFSPALKPDPELTKIVSCEIKVSGSSEVLKIKDIVPEFKNKKSSEILKLLRNNSFTWSISPITMAQALEYEKKCNEKNIEFILKP